MLHAFWVIPKLAAWRRLAKRAWKSVTRQWKWFVSVVAVVLAIIANLANFTSVYEFVSSRLQEGGETLPDHTLNIMVGRFADLSPKSLNDCCLAAAIQQDLKDGLQLAANQWQGNSDYSVLKVDDWTAVEFKERYRHMSTIEALKDCEVDRMVDGTGFWRSRRAPDHLLNVTAQWTDVPQARSLPPSIHQEGRRHVFAKSIGKLTLVALRRLGIVVSRDTQEQLRHRPTSYEYVCESLAQANRLQCPLRATAAVPTPTPQAPRSRNELLRRDVLAVSAGFASLAIAAESRADIEAQIKQRLSDYAEKYNAAYTSGNIELLAGFYETFDADVQQSLKRFFANAEGLVMRIDPATVVLGEIVDDATVVTFMRKDVFTDREERSRQDLHLRLTVIMVKQDGQWRIAQRR